MPDKHPKVIRCKNCAEPITHDGYDWVHADGYYLCDSRENKSLEGKYAE